jgi:hypothetical protein
VSFEMGLTGDTLVLLRGGDPPSRVAATKVRGDGSSLRFDLALDSLLECRLEPALAGGYEGECAGRASRATRLVMTPPLPGMLHPVHETSLALSAAPAHVSGPAAVYLFTTRGFVKVRDGTNGVACLVERPAIGDIWPVCYDAEGVARMLPVALARGELRVARVPEEEIERRLAEGYRAGRFRPAGRNGVAYMLSAHGRSVNRQTGEPVRLTPHLMLYAPFVTPEDIGGNGDLLGVMNQGRPDAYVIVRLPGFQTAEKNGGIR